MRKSFSLSFPSSPLIASQISLITNRTTFKPKSLSLFSYPSQLSLSSKRTFSSSYSSSSHHSRPPWNIKFLTGFLSLSSATLLAYFITKDSDALSNTSLSSSSLHCQSSSHSPSPLPLPFITSLSTHFGSRFTLDPSTLLSHSTDSSSHHSSHPPSSIIYPLTTEEVSLICKLCSEYNVIMIPYGSGTSLEGHTLPLCPPSLPTLLIDLSQMSKIIHLYEDDLQVVVQPGITWNSLNEFLVSPYELFFPMDPGPGASIGGMVGTSCSGTNAHYYGTMKQNVISLTMVMANGDIVKTGQRARKSSAGYDLTRLLIGSEGTLGIVTEIVLKIQPKIPYQSVILCQFNTIRGATNASIEMQRSGLRLLALELLDEKMIKIINKMNGFIYEEKPTILMKVGGTEERELITQIEKVKNVLMRKQITRKRNNIQDNNNKKNSDSLSLPSSSPSSSDRIDFLPSSFLFSLTPSEYSSLWEARKGALWSAMAYSPHRRVLTTDVCVPLSHLSDCLEETYDDIRKEGWSEWGPIVGHVGDGNFHCLLLFDESDVDERAKVMGMNERMVRRAIKYEGTCTGEHGIGMGKREFLVEEMGEKTMEMMKIIKKAVDPKGLLNPNKIFVTNEKMEREWEEWERGEKEKELRHEEENRKGKKEEQKDQNGDKRTGFPSMCVNKPHLCC